VTTHEESADRRAKVVAAGHATASWVRARRTAWGAAPLPLPRGARQVAAKAPVVAAPTPPGPPAEPRVPLADRVASASTAASTALKAPIDRARAVTESAVWSRVAEAPGSAVRALRDPIARWTPRLLVAIAVVGLGFVAIRYAPSILKTVADRAPAALTPTTTTPPATTARRTALKIESTPPGARTLVDGTDRGNTPLELDDVAPGKHVVTLESSVGTVQRSVTVTAGLTTEVNESIFAGFVTVFSPFEISITEGSRAFRPDDRNEIMLSAGRHELKLSNRALGFQEIRTVDISPGQRLTLSVTPPQSSISVTATEPSEVWLDNFKLGDTPLADTPATLGTHELVVRRAGGGERRLTITVTAKPFSIFVDFSKGT